MFVGLEMMLLYELFSFEKTENKQALKTLTVKPFILSKNTDSLNCVTF